MCGILFQIEISLQSIFPFKPQLQSAKKKINFSKLPYIQIAVKNNK